MRTSCGSPTVPSATAAATAAWPGSKRRVEAVWERGAAAPPPARARAAPPGAVGDGRGHGRVARVEAAVEADLERDAGVLHRGQRAVDLAEVERHRLLAEDRPAGLRGGHDELRVRPGGRTDRDRVGRGQRL